MADKLNPKQSTSSQPVEGPRFWPLTIATFVMFCFLVGLGFWQVQRLAWKEDLIARVVARQAAAPVTLSSILALQKSGEDIEYRRVAVRGQFRHEAEHFFYAPDPKLGPGFNVYTPFELSNAGGMIVVNRGFVPDALKATDKRQDGLVTGAQDIRGVIRLPGRKGAFTPDNDVAGNLWFWRDFDAMTAAVKGSVARTNIALFIDAEEPAPGGWPRGGVAKIEHSNRHLGYALTWFGLAATLLGVYGVLIRRRRRT